ncbi:hypothetical protein [Aequorivita marisscotiae]|uniref:Uncharacterized protein n=1 Tax=Aequorivita marisscotiae TaxID=3040348 RepID=A0ABY8KTE4_9FLAO|nr:hypothetical protein [Aequorivita sp. Ant34-E75]WGF91824.1 hypothetical protein QCQ61_11455 [Aequorivita sp. Ant34-E75]
MSFRTTYKVLFKLNVYHHYFLDNGATAFDSNLGLKEHQLTKYNFEDFCQIIPSEKTQEIFNGNRIVFKTFPAGFTIYIQADETTPNSGTYKPYVNLPQTTIFNFLIYVKDSLFENYSTVNSKPPIPYFFSNKKPDTEGVSFKYIDLETTTLPISDFTINQASYTEISKTLSEKEKLGLLGIISLEISGDDTIPFDGNARNILNVSGTIPANPKTFKIQFKNRKTIWNYRNAVNSNLLHSTDPTELPLAKNGIIGYTFDGKERPSAAPSRLIFEKDGSGNIIKTISEIYINQ